MEIRKEKLVILTPDEVRDLESANYRPINEAIISDLRESIKEAGLIEPITVRKAAGKLKIIKGDHRIETIRRLMREYPHLSIQVLAIVRHGEPESVDAVQQVLSNFSRREGVIDRACGFAHLRDAGKTTKQIAELTGKDRTNIEAHLHFHGLYAKHRELVAERITQLSESAWYRLGYRFTQDPQMNVDKAIEEALVPKPKKERPSAEAILAGAGLNAKEAKRLAGVLKKAKLLRT
jgi:ParB family chromosome partitioning protein